MYSKSGYSQNSRLLVKVLFVALLIGIFSGIICHLFSYFMTMATSARKSLGIIPFILLPFFGYISRWSYLAFGSEEERGNNLILDEMHAPMKKIRFRLIPLVVINSIFSHFFGASVGREGVGVQVGATIADQFSVNNFKRTKIIMLGISAGFGGMFLTPLAGAIFGIEIMEVGSYALDALVPCLVSSYSAYFVAQFLGDKNNMIRDLSFITFSFQNLIWILIAAIVFGLFARMFSYLLHHSKDLFKKISHNPKWQSFCGGFILSIIYFVLKSDRYNGISEEIFVDSFLGVKNNLDVLMKFFTTMVTVGAGFKGGEVAPILIIGSALGNFLSSYIPISSMLLAPLGGVSLLAGMANAPFAIFILSVELFGLEIASYSFFAILVTFLLSGDIGIYTSQRKKFKKL